MTAIEQGAALFNERKFFEAHEAWEELWLKLDGDARAFVQGLIQLAAAYHKATVQQQPRGCVMLLESALPKLRLGPYFGVRSEPLVAAAERTLLDARIWLANGPPLTELPRVEMVSF